MPIGMPSVYMINEKRFKATMKEHPGELSKDEWENLCDGCGKCCGFANSNFACPSLNVKTNRCRNYKKRFTTDICLSVRPDNVLNLHGRGILPDSCAYVRFVQKKPPLEVIESAALIPLELAPLSVRRRYKKARKRWLAMLAEAKRLAKAERPSV